MEHEDEVNAMLTAVLVSKFPKLSMRLMLLRPENRRLAMQLGVRIYPLPSSDWSVLWVYTLSPCPIGPSGGHIPSPLIRLVRPVGNIPSPLI
eukprot:3542463-Pyramimonas_sp.AAC.1